MNAVVPPLMGKLLIDTAAGGFLGEKRIRLLEAIALHGSILQAAKAVPMAYKAAWDAVDDMNNVAPEPLVLRATGGRHGGGSELTDFGRRLIAFYRALEQESQAAMARLSLQLDRAGDPDIAAYRAILKRLHMKSSARNQFAGPVGALSPGEVESEVSLALGPGLLLTALVTNESVQSMGLAEGREAMAFVKASSIVLMVGDEGTRVSARNRFRGTVRALHLGRVNAEVTLALPGGQHTLTAVITSASVDRLRLALGQPVTAVFKASSVFLMVND
ncbi:TOBE domain-containing protein [Hydrogenophaga pseudoflava]|uniref:TOBE domain-containing protein n=1 Tax=Hydrogenophaga pseudoflava TaxID=47421 RepID=UPI0027E4FEA2|nr:TOBE domain-containing protein [Hydrogenophaga pseudoflava]MDQ7743903.1 TOBE domain-containing protein [Hydrogenophaga pseudoflava]